MENLKNLLRKECDYIPSDALLDRLLGLGRLIKTESGSVLTETGQVDTNVYIVKKGIARFSDFDGNRERTFAFAMPGTIYYNKHSLVHDLPSYYQIDTWGETEMLIITKEDWLNLVTDCHEAALWMLRISMEELFYQEYKNARVYNGDASERFRALLRQRPELISNIPQKILASYLGISPEYFSRLKKKYGVTK